MKKFITTVSLQTKDLHPQHYLAADNSELENELAVSFPILITINNFVRKNEKILVCPIIIGANSTSRNYEIFKQELDEIARKTGFSYELKPIEKALADTTDDIIKLFGNLICAVDDNDELYADITYGTKPVPIVTIMALNYAYRVKKNVNINKIVYGLVPWEKGEASKIFDVSPLFYIDSAVNNLAKLNLRNPEETLKTLLGLE